MLREVLELFYYLSDALTRPLIYYEVTIAIRFEPIREGELDEAKAYVDRLRVSTTGGGVEP